jgi:toxin ParE1/3/4
MAHIIWSPDAINDLEIISDYISLDSERYASVVVTRIISLAEDILAFPMSGRIVPELEEENVREKFYKSYRIIYRINTDNTVDVLRVFHQAQELNINLD